MSKLDEKSVGNIIRIVWQIMKNVGLVNSEAHVSLLMLVLAIITNII